MRYFANIFLIVIGVLLTAVLIVKLHNTNLQIQKYELEIQINEYELEQQKLEKEQHDAFYEVEADVTAYNTVFNQTDSTPCIASGGYICGRNDVVACPRSIPLGTIVRISGFSYECMDRTAKKYDGRFDISFDKNIEGAIAFGKKRLTVQVYK